MTLNSLKTRGTRAGGNHTLDKVSTLPIIHAEREGLRRSIELRASLPIQGVVEPFGIAVLIVLGTPGESQRGVPLAVPIDGETSHRIVRLRWIDVFFFPRLQVESRQSNVMCRSKVWLRMLVEHNAGWQSSQHHPIGHSDPTKLGRQYRCGNTVDSYAQPDQNQSSLSLDVPNRARPLFGSVTVGSLERATSPGTVGYIP